MKARFSILLVFILFTISACDAFSTEGAEAHEYWVRAAPKGENTAAYMLIHNHSAEDDILTGASSDAAEVVELHLSQIDADGVMQMLPQESVPLPAGEEVLFEPGGYHIMMIGLVKDLNIGDQITLTLHFEHHEDIVLTVPVMDAASMGGEGMEGH